MTADFRKTQVRRLANLAVFLKAEQRSLVDVRHQKMDRMIELQRRETIQLGNLDQVRTAHHTSEGTEEHSYRKPLAETREEMASLKAEIPDLDASLEILTVDCGEAEALARAVIEFQGSTHPDLAGAGGVHGFPAGAEGFVPSKGPEGRAFLPGGGAA